MASGVSRSWYRASNDSQVWTLLSPNELPTLSGAPDTTGPLFCATALADDAPMEPLGVALEEARGGSCSGAPLPCRHSLCFRGK